MKARVTLLRDLGATISPFNAWQIIPGLETLPLRIERHSENAELVAKFLQGHSKVSNVIFPGLFTGSEGDRAKKYLKGGFSGLIGFELKGGKNAGRKFIDSLKLFYHVANIGDTRSLAIHPASTTHSQLDADEQLASGVTPGYVRLCIGIEHVDDIINDLTCALDEI